MVISKDVFYKLCGDMVYLRKVDSRRDYLLSSAAADVLDCCKKNPACGVEDICDYMESIYDIPDRDALKSDIESIVEQLSADGIFEVDKKPEEPKSVLGQAQLECLKTGQLFGATFEITYRCSERCKHCYVDSSCNNDVKAEISRELTLDEYKRIVDELWELGTLRLLITGGEVCLRPDFIDIARYAVNKGMIVDVYTNGISMTDEQFDALCEMKVNSVSFSLYGGDPDAHDEITGVNGSFYKTLNRAMMFKCAGVDTFIKSVVLKQTLPHMEKLHKIGKRLGIDIQQTVILTDTSEGRNPCRLECYEQYKQAVSLEQSMLDRPLSSKSRNFDGVICYGGHISLSVDPYGNIRPCNAFKGIAGSVREQSIRDIWENSEFLKKVRAFRFFDIDKNCRECEYNKTCSICIGDCYNEKTGKISPSEDVCMIARAVNEAVNEFNERKAK